MILATSQRVVPAPVEQVWSLVSTAQGLRRWMAVEATVDLRPGGVIRWVHDNGWVVAGEIREVVPPRRLVFTYGWEEGGFPVPAGSSQVTLTLRPGRDGDTTVLDIRHRGLPHRDLAERHEEGWGLFLDRLVAAVDESPGPATGGHVDDDARTETSTPDRDEVGP